GACACVRRGILAENGVVLQPREWPVVGDDCLAPPGGAAELESNPVADGHTRDRLPPELVLKLVYCETSRWQRFCVGRIRRSRNPTRNVVMPTCLSDYASLPKVGALGDPTYGSN